MRRSLPLLILAACGDNAVVPDAPAAIDAPPDAKRPAFVLDPTYGTNGRLIIDTDLTAPLSSILISSMPDGAAMLTAAGDTIADGLRACRVLPTGVPDPGFASGSCVDPQMLGILQDNVVPDGNALLILSLSQAPGISGFVVRKLLSNGTLDPTYVAQPSYPVGSFSSSAATVLVGLADGKQMLVGLSARTATGGDYAPFLQLVTNGVTSPSQPPLLRSAMAGVCATSLGTTAAVLVGVNETRLACPSTACVANLVCRYGDCVLPPADCSAGQSCPTGTSCDGGECIDTSVRGTGTWIFSVDESLSTSPYRRSARLAKRAFPLADTSLLISQRATSFSTLGMWKVNAAFGEDFAFGTGGVAVDDFLVRDVAELPGGELVVAGQKDGFGGTSELRLLSASGQSIETVSDPVPGVKLLAAKLLSDGKLLVSGYMDNRIVVARLMQP